MNRKIFFYIVFPILFVALAQMSGLLIIPTKSTRRVAAGKARPNVLVVLIDTLRTDHLQFMGYKRDTSPVISKFAEDNINYSYAVSPSAWTPPSVASIMTGMYPSVHGHMPLKEGKGSTFTKLDDSFHTLAEIMTSQGYDTAAISANPLVSEKFGLHQGFKLFVSPGRELAEKVNKRALKYLEEMRPADKPFFLYLHYMDPHFTYNAPAPYTDMYSGPIDLDGLFKGREYRKREIKFMGRYDGEIRYTDDHISRIFAWLKEKNLYDNTVIAIISDHGEQFMERGHLGHADRLHSEEIRVPFLLKANGRREKIDTPVTLVDFFPTLLEATGIALKHQVNGVSLLSHLDERKEQGVLAEVIRHYNQKAIIDSQGRKAIFQYPMDRGLLLSSLDDPMSVKVFDTQSDFAEVLPLTDDALQSQLKEQLNKLYTEGIKLREQYSIGETAADEETIKNLKTLGYM